MLLWLGQWINNPGILNKNPLGTSKVNSDTHSSDVMRVSLMSGNLL